MRVELFEQEEKTTGALLRLQVLAEADPGAVAGVLDRFQILNITPRRIVAEAGIADNLHIAVDILGLSERRMSIITAKIRQMPCILNAYWHYA